MKVLVFGGTGMLGHIVVKHLVSKDHDVTFTVRDNKVPNWFPMSKRAAVIKFSATGKIPDLTGYDWVINCIGNIKQKENLKSVDYYQINSVFPWRLSLACKKVGVKMIHVSTDCVFSGEKIFSKGQDNILNSYGPLDKLDAKDDYGMSKALGECSDAVVIRTSIIGPSDKTHGLFEWFRNAPDTVDGYVNHFWSGVTTLFLAQFIERLMTAPEIEIPQEGGLIQLASPPLSKYTLLKLISDVFDIPKVVYEAVPPNGEPINRTLLPSVKYAPDIHSQLVELRDWMKINGD
jgi:dTDP-4-dehydrorhamnose reductase